MLFLNGLKLNISNLIIEVKMLYFIEESFNLMLSPARQSSRIIKSLIKEMPHSGVAAPWLNTVNAWMTVFEEFSGIHEKPKWQLHEIMVDGVAYRVEDEVVLKRAYCQLVPIIIANNHDYLSLLPIRVITPHC
ncbi:MAG: hypothetical protein B7X47_08695 [Ferrovum sp. 34-44-207]|nr:MAG: hypothetical protein B7X47_08695 [Ferrovum sp. 34-44-207]